MATRGSNATAVLIAGGYDIRGTRTQIAESHEGLFEDTTPFGVTDATSGYVGLKRGSFSQGGFYDDTANSINDAMLNTINGTDQVTVLALSGNTLGAPFIGYAGLLTAKYDRLPAVGKFTRANGSCQVDGIVEDLVTNTILYPQGAANTDTGTGTAVDYGSGTTAATTNGGSSYLEVTALTLGTRTGLSVVMQDSPDNSSWTDRITHTTVTAAPAAERKTMAGNVARYTRTRWAYTGGSSGGTSANIFAGFVRNA